MAKKDELTPRQMQFAMLYAVGDKTGSECAKLCGYQSPSSESSRLLCNAKVGGVIAEQK